MNLRTQRLTELFASNISYGMQRQAVVQFMVIKQILSDTVHDQVEQLMLFMQEQGNRQITNLLLGILGGRDEIHSLEVAEIHIIALDVNVEQLADIFLLLVSIEIASLELLPNIGQLLIDALLLEFSGACIAQISDELDQTSHGRHDEYGRL